MLRSASIRLAAVLALALLAPAAAVAQTTPAQAVIDGSPLNVYANPNGSIQTSVDGYDVSEFFPFATTDDSGNLIPSQNANAGFALLVTDTRAQSTTFYSAYGGTPFPNAEGPTVTPGDPATINGAWTINGGTTGTPLLRVTETLTYSNGARQFNSVFTVTNVGGYSVPIRAGVGGDLAIRGSDSGIGFLDPGPPRFVGGVNPAVGAAGGFVEDTPWSHYQVGPYGTVSSNLQSTGLTDQIETQSVDNGAAVQWDNPGTLNPGASAEYRVGWRFVDTLGLNPPSGTEQTGSEHVVKASLAGINGAPGANQPLRWDVTGANPASGAVTTDAKGQASIGWIGGNPGDDLLTVYQDTNNNGTRDTDETQATATVTWQGPPAPIIGQTVGVRPEAGTVRIQLPRGTSAARAKTLGLAPEAREKFVKLTGATTVPVGSVLDTSKGTVRLLSAGLPTKNNSSFNGGSFHGARFGVGQRGNRPLTTLTMSGGGLNRCNTRVPKGGAKGKIVSEARRRSRRLFGSGRGRFRTRGRNSSATVRGTKWLQKDTCSGTLTSVQRGSVTVRDFTKRKTVVVKAGKKYFARAPKGRR